jgi:magnesium chelatase accessory protein
MSKRLDWSTDGRLWPNREASRFVEAAGVRWHVQVMGSGPVLLLLHGTGASTHSWRKAAKLLASEFCIVMPDLPGHAFSTLPRQGQFSMPGMADAVSVLLKEMQLTPAVAVGHSAGAAIVLRMILDGGIQPKSAVSFNGALLPFPGLGEFVFPAMAKLLFLNPFAAPIAARLAQGPGMVDRLIKRTGSQLDQENLEFYAKLICNQAHVEATLSMMANWGLQALKYEMRRLKTLLTLVSAEKDLAVPPSVAAEVKKFVPAAKVILLAGHGHLAHEVAPDMAADIIRTSYAGAI